MDAVETVLRALNPQLGSSAANVIKAVGGVSQTQQDVTKIANLAQQVQTPSFQQELATAETAAIAYGSTQIFLQLVATGATVLMAYIAWQNYKRRS